MKFSYFFLSMPLLLITSCGASSSPSVAVTREQAKGIVSNSLEKIDKDNYEFPSAFTFTHVSNFPGQSENKKYSYNKEKKYAYISDSLVSSEKWYYVQDDKLYSVDSIKSSDGNSATYSVGDSGNWASSSEIIEGEGGNRCITIMRYLQSYFSILDSSSSSSSSGGLTVKLSEETYNSSGEGNLSISAKMVITNSGVSSNSTANVKIDNGLLVSEETTATLTSGESYSETYNYSWGQCTCSYPDLKQYSSVEGAGGSK